MYVTATPRAREKNLWRDSVMGALPDTTHSLPRRIAGTRRYRRYRRWFHSVYYFFFPLYSP